MAPNFLGARPSSCAALRGLGWRCACSQALALYDWFARAAWLCAAPAMAAETALAEPLPPAAAAAAAAAVAAACQGSIRT
jgi:hypothetical protein